MARALDKVVSRAEFWPCGTSVRRRCRKSVDGKARRLERNGSCKFLLAWPKLVRGYSRAFWRTLRLSFSIFHLCATQAASSTTLYGQRQVGHEAVAVKAFFRVASRFRFSKPVTRSRHLRRCGRGTVTTTIDTVDDAGGRVDGCSKTESSIPGMLLLNQWWGRWLAYEDEMASGRAPPEEAVGEKQVVAERSDWPWEGARP